MDTFSKKVIVVGTGFKGMMAALKLVNKGYKVTIIDGSNHFGGVLNSPKWDEMYIDLGCHLFFNQEDELTQDILDILSHQIKSVPSNYASYFKQQITEDIAIPNLELLSNFEKKAVYHDLLYPKETFSKVTSLDQFYVNRFGQTASNWINQFIDKAFGIKSKELDLMANYLLPYDRIRVFPVQEALELKEKKWYDDRIAIPRKTNLKENTVQKTFSFFEYYPSKEGLYFFCNKLRGILIEKGVEIKLGQPIESIQLEDEFIVKTKKGIIKTHYLYWAAPQYLLPKVFNLNIDLQSYLHPVPMILFYFTVKKEAVKDYTYVQNYDTEDFCFRVSIQSNYADNKIPKNLSLICCEVPSKVDSKMWKNPENYSTRIWGEVNKMGISTSSSFHNTKFLKTPSPFTLPLKGYLKQIEHVKSKLHFENLLGIKNWDYSKNDILRAIHKELKEI